MPEYLLRVDGVNFANVIDDTDNLSTRRGGGLMVLLDSTLRGADGSGRHAAVTNKAGLYARNVRTEGYRVAVENQAGHRRSAARRHALLQYGGRLCSTARGNAATAGWAYGGLLLHAPVRAAHKRGRESAAVDGGTESGGARRHPSGHPHPSVYGPPRHLRLRT